MAGVLDKIELKDCISRRVTEYYVANPPAAEQITHTQSVAAYTRLIAAGEGWEYGRVELVEMAAWLHDIGCPVARKLYGNSLPVHQQEEGRKLTAKKKRLYGEYQKARRDMQEIVTIKANIDTLLGYTEPGRKQEKER